MYLYYLYIFILFDEWNYKNKDGCSGRRFEWKDPITYKVFIYLLRLSSDANTMEYVPTVFDNYNVDVNYKGDIIRLELWDTAGA